MLWEKSLKKTSGNFMLCQGRLKIVIMKRSLEKLNDLNNEHG